jgi:DNA-binding transcriptional LysR family regulator
MTVEYLNDLYLFGRVVEAGGFAAAERQTGVPKSRLSRRVAALERHLNARLIQRSAQSFAVTQIGQTVYQHARRVTDEADALHATIGEALTEPSGLIRVSTSVFTGELLLAGWLAEFQVQYPRVHISLDLSNRFVDLISERIDLAVRYSSTPLRSADIVARPLGTSRMILVGSPNLIAKLGEPGEIADLERFPTLAQGTLEGMRAWVFKAADGSPVIHQPQPVFVTDNILALREAAVRGAGLIQLPLEACREALAAGTLKPLLEHHQSIGTPVYALYPSRRGMPAGVRALLGFLEQCFRSVQERTD